MVFAACELACKSGKTVPIETPRSAIRFIRAEVMQFNGKNPPWECEVRRDGDFLEIVPLSIDTPETVVDQIRGIAFGELLDHDSKEIKTLYDMATKNDMVAVRKGIKRGKVSKIVQELNDARRGDIGLRSFGGQLYLYRKFWLGGRNFTLALKKWQAVNRIK